MSTHATHPLPDAPAHPGGTERQPWSILVLLSLAQFMVILDITIVNVALPSIGASLGFATADLQWVVTIYVLFTGGLLLLGGRLTDLLGRRRIFLVGLLLFTVASLASGLAWSPAALIVSRAAQGLGAAMLSPAALSLITTTYTGSQRTTALAVWGAIGGAGAAAGVLIGGVLTSALSWEWVFFVNVPIGLATAALLPRLVPAAAPDVPDRRLDVPGAVALVAGLVALVYAVQGTSTHGWGSARTLGLLAGGVVLLAAFAAIERAVARPLVPPATWRVRSLVASAAVMVGSMGLLGGTFFLNSLYMQRVLDASALETGLAFLPLTVAIGLAAHAATRLLPLLGSRVLVVIGLVLVAGGALVLAAAPEDASYGTDLLPGFLVIAAGVGLVFACLPVTAMAHVGHDQAGLASGLMFTAHEIGAATGVAALSTIAASSDGLAAGYGDGYTVAAIVAAALAIIALVALPAVRPEPGAQRAPMH
jgi:EmrB/QacA subfamily drug resistance transporter